ncbi:MAG: hypothetical protein E6Q37_03170 [Crocinitomicaceae bacterium]|nr:MAG: hypothetical protein E6Q37_03170 [Crocinitomicaceae bacterium]
MKYIVYFAVLFLALTSCSEWKYSNGIGRSKKIVYRDAEATRTTDTKQVSSEIAVNSVADSVVQPDLTEAQFGVKRAAVSPVSLKQVTRIDEPRLQPHATVDPLTESVEEEEKPDPSIVSSALEAERKGRQSRNLGIAGLAVTILLVLFFPGFLLAVISLIKGINSMRSQYNTPEGISMARTGIVLSSITLILYLLAFLLILSLILLIL